MKRRFALACLASLVAASLSACSRKPAMIDIRRQLPPGLEQGNWSMSQAGEGLRLEVQRLRAGLVREGAGQFTQSLDLLAPEGQDMHASVAFYDQVLKASEWHSLGALESDFGSYSWSLGDQALLLVWRVEPLDMDGRRVRLVRVMATPAAQAGAV